MKENETTENSELITTLLSELEAARVPIKARKKDRVWKKIVQTNNAYDVLDHSDDYRDRSVKVRAIHPTYGSAELNRKAKNKNTNSYLLKIAAAVSLFIVSTLLLFYTNNTFLTGSEEVLWVRKQNPSGQKSKVTLPDGSKVILNASSELLYKEEFVSDKREIFLKGEAFFEVEKMAGHPFVVHAGDVSTTALGTSFNITSFKERSGVSVSLVTGKVSVAAGSNDNQNKHILNPGEQLFFDFTTREISKENFDPEITLGWKDGVLWFAKADKEEIFSSLSRWYGVGFEFKNVSEKISDWRYTGHYENETLERVLQGLSYTQKFNYEIKDNIVTVIFN